MGSGASTRSERRQREVEKHRTLRSVERFVINVYATCPRVESMLLLLSSELAQKAFANFVKSERAEENFLLYSAAIKINEKKLNAYQLSKEVEHIIIEFLQPDTAMQVMVSKQLQDAAMAILNADKDSEEYTKNIAKLLNNIVDESVFLMARDQFNRFILSKYYKTWRSAESSHAMATTAEDATEMAKRRGNASVSASHTIASERSTSNGGHQRRKLTRHEDLSVRAFINIDVKEIGRLLGAESWLTALLAAAEGLPLSFSLASARKDRKGFPLLYVNKYFEKLSGFARSDVLGKGCRFLQCPDTERDKVLQMSDALRTAQQCCVVLTNKSFQGRIFKNLVALKPIFSESGVYCYVIGIQIDVTREVDNYESKLKLAMELIDMLPSVLLVDDEHKSGCLPIGGNKD